MLEYIAGPMRNRAIPALAQLKFHAVEAGAQADFGLQADGKLEDQQAVLIPRDWFVFWKVRCWF